jgi:hypothetical protein
LKCALGHGSALLFPIENSCLDGKIQVYRRLCQESSAPSRKLDDFLVSFGSRSLASVRTVSACKRELLRFFRPLSPSMVQRETDSAKYCEWGIATIVKCATIGTVHESFQRPTEVVSSRVPFFASGAITASRQVLSSNSTVS